MILRSVLLILLFSVLHSTFSQTYSGKVLEMGSKEPVAYANIGIVDKNIGTVSDANGYFDIELTSQDDKDTLRISCIGYMDKYFLIRDFKNEFSAGDEIRIELTSIAYNLDEVLIRPQKTRPYILGYLCDSNSAYGNAFYSSELGTEMGVVMKLPRKKEQAYLKSFRFYVGEFTFDTFPVRLNIYDLKDGIPDKNILKEPVFIEIESAGEYVLDLNRQNITVYGDFFVSLEYYRIPDNAEGKLVFCAVHSKGREKGNSYFRWTSQGNWQKEMFDHVGFSCEVECKK
ncbi:MAG: carboxypeptidase-like regulatory domain-containing protein [Bacteroidales bacterium]|nr:carboxypeptidase-like regulatory domain-containing protein [Bacteroidales bacterium]